MSNDTPAYSLTREPRHKTIMWLLLLLLIFSVALASSPEEIKWRSFLRIPPRSRLYAVTMELEGMSMKEVHRWWDRQGPHLQPLINDAILGVLDAPHLDVCDAMIIRYKQLFKLACLSFPDDELFPLFRALVLEGRMKWPLNFVSRLFVNSLNKSADSLPDSSWSHIANPSDNERAILETPLFHLVPMAKMTLFLTSLPVNQRSEFMIEMPLHKVPLYSMIGMIQNPIILPEILEQALRHTKERWLRSTGLYISPICREALFYLLKSRSRLFGISDAALSFLRLAYVVEYRFDLALISESSLSKRKSHLSHLKSTIEKDHEAWKVQSSTLELDPNDTYTAIRIGNWEDVINYDRPTSLHESLRSKFEGEVEEANRTMRVKHAALILESRFSRADVSARRAQLVQEVNQMVFDLNVRFEETFGKADMFSCAEESFPLNEPAKSSKLLVTMIQYLALPEMIDSLLLNSVINPFAWNSDSLGSLGQPVQVTQTPGDRLPNPISILAGLLRGPSVNRRRDKLLGLLSEILNDVDQFVILTPNQPQIDNIERLVEGTEAELQRMNLLLRSGKSIQFNAEACPDQIYVVGRTVGSSLDKPTVQMGYSPCKVTEVGSFINPSLLFGWLSDRWPSAEETIWWHVHTVQSGFLPHSALIFHHTLQGIGHEMLKEYISKAEFDELATALRQIFVTGSIAHATRNKPTLRRQLLRTLLEHARFRYFAAGWFGSAFDPVGHAIIARIEKEAPLTDQLYTVTLFNSGLGTETYHAQNRMADNKNEFSSFVKYEHLTIGDLEKAYFFNPPEKNNATDASPLSYIYQFGLGVTVDKAKEHLWFRSQISGTCAHTVIRLLMRYLLGSIHKARIVRFEVSKELVARFKDNNRVTWLKYSSFHDYWQYFRNRLARHAAGKLMRQLMETKTAKEFEWMLKVIEIWEKHILTLEQGMIFRDGSQRSTGYPRTPSTPGNPLNSPWNEDLFVLPTSPPASYRGPTTPSTAAYLPLPGTPPASPSALQLTLDFETFLSKDFIRTLMEWKGFSVPNWTFIIGPLEAGTMSRRLVEFIRHSDVENSLTDAQNALNFLLRHFSGPLISAFPRDTLELIFRKPGIQVHEELLRLPFQYDDWVEHLIMVEDLAIKGYSNTSMRIFHVLLAKSAKESDRQERFKRIRAKLVDMKSRYATANRVSRLPAQIITILFPEGIKQ